MPIYAPMILKGKGGALPTYQRQSGVYVPGEGINARADDSAGRIRRAGQEATARALGNLGRFRPVPTEETAMQIRLAQERENPWFTLLDEEMRDAFIQAKYLEELGVRVELTPEERAAFQKAINTYNARAAR